MGRPKIAIDYELVARLAHIHCTHEEIASALKVSVSLLEHDEHFLQVYKSGLDEGRKSLRRMQFESAEGCDGDALKDEDGSIILDSKGHAQWVRPPRRPSATMQIWLGKQLLGQRDQVGLTGRDGGPIAQQQITPLTDEQLEEFVLTGKIKDRSNGHSN